jgi:predicted nuclease of predicted toxin-antitoxin system
MRFLADESVDMAVVRALREAGHDVRAIAEDEPGAGDATVAERARADERTLLTEDRDFGRLVFALNQPTGGVIYMRYNAARRLAFASEVASVVAREDHRLLEAFTVIQPGRTRIGRLPPTFGG